MWGHFACHACGERRGSWAYACACGHRGMDRVKAGSQHDIIDEIFADHRVIGGVDAVCKRCKVTTQHITLMPPRAQCGTCGSIHEIEAEEPAEPAEQRGQMELFR